MCVQGELTILITDCVPNPLAPRHHHAQDCDKPKQSKLPTNVNASRSCQCESFNCECTLDKVQHFQLRTDQVRLVNTIQRINMDKSD